MRKNKQADWIWLLLIGCIYVLLRIHTLSIPLDRDEGMFGYAAQRIIEGGKPYRDALDHKPPGVFYLYALALEFFPATPTGVHLFLLLYNFATLIAVTLLVRIRFPSKHAWLGAAFCYALFSASPAIQGFTASTEMLMLLPISVCLLLAIAARHYCCRTFIIASGAVGSVALWIKPTAISSITFAAIYLLAGSQLDDQSQCQPRRQRLVDLLLWIAGAAIISMGVMGYFYLTGLLRELVYWSFTHNAVYASNVAIHQTAISAIRSLKEIGRGDLVMAGLGIVGGVCNLVKRKSDSMFVLGFLFVSMAGTLPGFAFPHYFAQLAPAVAVASGWALSVIGERAKRPVAIVAVLIATMTVNSLYEHWSYFASVRPEVFSRSFFGLSPFPESVELSAFLAARTSAQDRIFIFGSEPQILFYAKRKSATPFAMIYPLTSAYPRYREFQERVWHDIEQNHPVYILFVNLPDSIAWDGKADIRIQGRVGQLVKKEYSMVAILPVRERPTHLFIIGDMRSIPPDLLQNPANIFVYRRVS
jgi:4-amino-4-deoxy-L-arabinose transferase-like glycosyltransferase